MNDGGQRRDIGLGRGDTVFLSGAQRQEVICKIAQRCIIGIDQYHDRGPRCFRRPGCFDQIRTASGLRNRDEQAIAQILPRTIDRAHRR